MRVYCHPKCSTCKKALKWLEEKEVQYEVINIITNAPSSQELEWAYAKYQKWGRVFNTSGIQYREQQMSAKVKTASEKELFDILKSNGMLVKRPFVVKGDVVVTGFREEEWNELIE